MASQHDLRAWANETTLGRRLFNHNYRMSGREQPGWQLLKTVPMHRDRVLAETTYLWQGTDAPDRQLVRVSVAELPDWRAAQKHLREALAHCMRPDLPRGPGGVGDVEFVAREAPSDVPAAVHFVRGNVAVSVNSVGSVAVDVSGMAATVDRALADSPSKVAFLRTRAKRLPPQTISVKRRGKISLVKDVSKVGERWLKVIVPDGEVRRTANALVYTAHEPGKKTVQIYSIAGSKAQTSR